MASVGTLIATGGGAGDTTTITVTDTHEANEQIQMFWLSMHANASFFESTFPDSIADSKGGIWETFAGFPLRQPQIGYTADGVTDGDGKFKIQVATATRQTGFALKPGDTITVTWDNPGDSPAATECCLIVQGFNGLAYRAMEQTVNFGDVEYGNGDSGDNTGTLGHTPADNLSWFDDYGSDFMAIPDGDCAFIGAYGSKHGNAFSPHDSPTVIAELERSTATSSLYLAVTFSPLIAASTVLEPGGTFANTPSVSVGNYQFIKFAGTTTTTAPTAGAHWKHTIG